MMTTTTYRWRVLEIGPGPDPWRMKGKVLTWAMTEESASEYQAKKGCRLVKVPHSETVHHDYGSTGHAQRGWREPMAGAPKESAKKGSPPDTDPSTQGNLTF